MPLFYKSQISYNIGRILHGKQRLTARLLGLYHRNFPYRYIPSVSKISHAFIKLQRADSCARACASKENTYALKLLAKTCVHRRCETSFTKWCYTVKLLFFHHCDRCEVESGSTSRETCLATDVRKRFTKPTMLHGATPAETCFGTPLHTSFS